MLFKKEDIIPGSVTAVIAILILFVSVQLNGKVSTLQHMSEVAGPGGFPTVIAIMMLIIGVVYIIGSAVRIKKEKNEQESISGVTLRAKITAADRPIKLMLLSFAYILVLNWTGFIVTSIIYIYVALVLLECKSIKLRIIFSISFSVILYLVFTVGLKVFLPVLSRSLGI